MALEGIFVNCVTEILKKLVPLAAQEINLAWGVKDEMKKLQDTLEMILAVIADAERRQVTDKAVRLWLRRLKEVAYDADDVMDEFPYETMRRSERGNSLKLKARDFLSSANPLVFHFKMARKMKSINQRLDRITKDMRDFQLQPTPSRDAAGATPGESSEQRSRDTASFINESDIFGREVDKKIIIDMLMKVIPSSSSSDTSIPEKITVVSIVGMGGLGKTTLAQLVYRDELVRKQFELTMWVHVSEHFDVIKLLTKIMESSTKTKFDTLSNYDVLVSKVQEQLNGKRYLLVLDDLWNENADQWDRLCIPLLVGAQGSKILITTRKSQVADIVRGSIPPYKLGKLQEDECWSIMEKRAFSPGGAVKTPNMTSIGKGIAKKCGGVPLAAKFLGGLMRLKNKEADWLSIQDVDVLNTREGQSEIIPIIKLSYDNLSSELKQCFSYCSIFPKDWEINRVTLIQLWIAEGFLDTCNVGNGRSIEDIADEYFVSLVSSSFLDAAEKSLLGDIKTCKMHDLVHDLAKAVAGDQESASVKVSELNHTTKIRRLRLILDVDLSSTVFQKSLSNAKKLRTLFIPEGSNLDPCIFAENKHLRILHVGRSPNLSFSKLTSLSYKLRHLRYLHLTCIDLRHLRYFFDQSISKLYSLETLVLYGIAGRVQILISNIHSLKNLRYLEVSFTYMVKLPDSFTSLCNLQTLDLNNCSLKVIPESICGLKKLRFLNLSVNPFEELPVSVTTLSNLETLDVNTCKNLKALPEYVAGLPNLRVFDFKECPLLKALPIDIGALTLLRYLNLAGTQISVLPESCVNLRNLEIVDLGWCEVPKDVKNWTKLRRFYRLRRTPILGLGQLSFLEEFVYWVQKKLKTEPEGNEGIEELGNLNSLVELTIINLQNVKDPVDAERANLKGKHNLRTLYLHWEEIEEESGMKLDKNSRNFQVFQALQPPTCLRRLGIYNFMVSELPMWMCGSCLPNLVELEFIDCVGIKQLPAFIGQLPYLKSLKLQGRHLESLDISGFPSLNQLELIGAFLVEEFDYSGPLPCLQELVIESCNRLREIPSFPSLEGLKLQKIDHKLVWSLGRSQTTSLTSLYLEDIEELIYFPISILRKNCNLRVLNIQGCNQLEGFGEIDNEKENKVALTGPEIYTGSLGLGALVLYDCALLKFLPDLRGWSCLQFLYIFNCPQVKESLTYDLKSLSFLKALKVDFIQRDQQRGDPSTVEDLINLVEKH